MKKISIIIAALFMINICEGVAQTGSSQTDNREKLQFGLKAGLNYSNVYDASGDAFKADAKFGAAGGLFLRIPIGKYFGIQPEILFSQKGFKASGLILGSEYDFTRTTTFIDVPLLFELKPSEFFTLVAGPQYSYLITQQDVFTSSAASYSQEQQFQNENFRKNIFGVVGGFDINLKHIVLGARAGWDIQDNNGDGSSTSPRYKNVFFQGTIGYSIYSKNKN